jgi:hypothetical protein
MQDMMSQEQYNKCIEDICDALSKNDVNVPTGIICLIEIICNTCIEFKKPKSMLLEFVDKIYEELNNEE